MTILADIQQLEPGSKVELFELDATTIGGDIARFHACADGPLTWQGQVYSPWPITAEGFSRTSDQQPTPKLLVGNLDGSITALCQEFDDLVGARLTRRRTFGKYLDAVNFPEGNPAANPDQEFPPEIWFIERKAVETPQVVEFELSSALDFNGAKWPARQIIAGQCPASWVYRGANCGYTGPPVADANDNPTTNPALDRCGKRLGSCKLRQWPDDVIGFGGFPAAGLARTS